MQMLSHIAAAEAYMCARMYNSNKSHIVKVTVPKYQVLFYVLPNLMHT